MIASNDMGNFFYQYSRYCSAMRISPVRNSSDWALSDKTVDWSTCITETDPQNIVSSSNEIYIWGVLVLLKFHWAPGIMEFVLDRFSHFNIAIAYSNSKVCGTWTPIFCEFTWNFSKTSTPQTSNFFEKVCHFPTFNFFVNLSARTTVIPGIQSFV